MAKSAGARNTAAPTIALFDSGVGGLTVLAQLLRLAPRARYLYFGDTARLPYGSKSAATVARYATSAAHFLEARGAELLVVACNTATALAFEEIRGAVKIPVLGVVEPGADAAAAASQTGCAAVVATEATIASHAYGRALKARGLRTVEKACPLLVPLVEEGWLEHPVTARVAKIYLQEIFAASEGRAAAGHSANRSGRGKNGGRGRAADEPDVLLLGCTHYPLLYPLLRRLTPKRVAIVDSAACSAQAVAEHFGIETRDGRATRAAAEAGASIQFFATDSAEKFRKSGERFLGRAIGRVEHVDLEELPEREIAGVRR